MLNQRVNRGRLRGGKCGGTAPHTHTPLDDAVRHPSCTGACQVINGWIIIVMVISIPIQCGAVQLLPRGGCPSQVAMLNLAKSILVHHKQYCLATSVVLLLLMVFVYLLRW